MMTSLIIKNPVKIFCLVFLLAVSVSLSAPSTRAQDNAGDVFRDLLGELLKGTQDDGVRGGPEPAPGGGGIFKGGPEPAPPRGDPPGNGGIYKGGPEPAPENPIASTPRDPGGERRLPFSRRQIQLSFAPLVERTAPAVVNVYAARQVRARSPFAGDPFFERFFGQRQAPPRMQSSLGSGVIVHGSGIVVTNYHVVGGADEVKVALSDGREFESRILLKEEALDLAILKIDGNRRFPALPFGDSDALLVGDLVLAIGNPFGVGQTTTSGIVSALARTHVGVSDFGFFIQTDAAINPGNSGGALIDMNGRLIGINTAIFTRSGGSNGIGFAIPSNLVRAVVQSAQRGSDKFERPWIGAEFQAVTPAVADSLGMRRPVGALVGNVTPKSPAARAGLRPGDVVLAINGIPIEHMDALGYRLATMAIGDVTDLTILRRGRQATVSIRLQAEPAGAVSAQITIDGNSPFAGTTVGMLDRRLARKFRLRPETQGVAVVDIEGGGPANRFGLQRGDIVREVNGEVIETPEQLAEVAKSGSRWWRFAIERRGRILRQTLRY